MARAGGELSSTIMVGDAGPDIGVARRAGVPVIGVEFGYTEVPIADLKPDRLIGHMQGFAGRRGKPDAASELKSLAKSLTKPLIRQGCSGRWLTKLTIT